MVLARKEELGGMGTGSGPLPPHFISPMDFFSISQLDRIEDRRRGIETIGTGNESVELAS